MKKRTNYEILKGLINEFKYVETKEQALENYKWYSLASGIKDDEEVLKIMQEILVQNK